jgi:hypothetical protein
MASSKNLVAHKTRIFEPVIHVANSRAEFRLPADQLYFSDLRLINVGAVANNATEYNSILGAECMIQSLRLYDGATEIDAVNDFPQWRAVQKLKVANDGAISVGKILSKNGIGYILSGTDDLEQATFANNPIVNTAQGAGTVGQKAWISLKSVFPFLAQTPVLPTSIFRQLRVEIEYHSSADLANFVVDATQNGIVTARSLLLADEITSPTAEAMLLEQFAATPLVWKSPVEDSFLLNATTAPADAAGQRVVPEEQTQRLRAFDSHYVHDLVLKVVPLTTPTSAVNTNKVFGAVGSLAQRDASVQVAVNGANVHPREGLRGHMRALAQLTDSIGSIDTFALQQFSSLTFQGNVASAPLITTAGQAAIWATDIEQGVEDLSVTVRRSGVFGNPQTYEQQRVYVYGRCAKALELMQGAGGPGGEAAYQLKNL